MTLARLVKNLAVAGVLDDKHHQKTIGEQVEVWNFF